jgi:hypothetical protein
VCWFSMVVFGVEVEIDAWHFRLDLFLLLFR